MDIDPVALHESSTRPLQMVLADEREPKDVSFICEY